MQRIEVRHEDGDRFEIDVRGHEVIVDQPVGDGGRDTAPTPTELWVAGLASCVAFYAGRFCSRHDVDPEGLRVTCDFAMAEDRPARVREIMIKVYAPPAFPETKLDRLQAVVDHCTVHNSMVQPPEVAISCGVAATA
jgi:uncharacterized OsmC-like protein